MSVVKEALKDDEASISRENNEFSTESGSLVTELSMKNIHQETPENYGFTCHTVCDFPGEEEGDLVFAEGEILTVLGIRDDGWWEAENADGKRG
ncbi:Growth arrest-specific protein 7, partial [Stegodyphus mimosarum]